MQLKVKKNKRLERKRACFPSMTEKKKERINKNTKKCRKIRSPTQRVNLNFEFFLNSNSPGCLFHTRYISFLSDSFLCLSF